MMIDKDELLKMLEEIYQNMKARKMDARFRDGFSQAIIEVEGFKKLFVEDRPTLKSNKKLFVEDRPPLKSNYKAKFKANLVSMHDVIDAKEGTIFYLEVKGFADMIMPVCVKMDYEENQMAHMTTQDAPKITLDYSPNDYMKKWRLWDRRPSTKAMNYYQWYSLEDGQ